MHRWNKDAWEDMFNGSRLHPRLGTVRKVRKGWMAIDPLGVDRGTFETMVSAKAHLAKWAEDPDRKTA